jgi:hypothetical protein
MPLPRRIFGRKLSGMPRCPADPWGDHHEPQHEEARGKWRGGQQQDDEREIEQLHERTPASRANANQPKRSRDVSSSLSESYVKPPSDDECST